MLLQAITIQGPCSGSWTFNGKDIGNATRMIAGTDGNYTLICDNSKHTYIIAREERRFLACAYTLGVVACATVTLLILTVANFLQSRQIEKRIHFVISANPIYQ